MVTRVYLSTHRGILSGEVSEDVQHRISQYRNVFSDIDSSGPGSGFFEVQLDSCFESDEEYENLYLRATKEETKFGYYGPEGWRCLHSDYRREQNDETVIFDSMIPHYAYEDQVNEYSLGPEYEEILDSIHSDDIELFNKVFEDYVESER